MVSKAAEYQQVYAYIEKNNPGRPPAWCAREARRYIARARREESRASKKQKPGG